MGTLGAIKAWASRWKHRVKTGTINIDYMGPETVILPWLTSPCLKSTRRTRPLEWVWMVWKWTDSAFYRPVTSLVKTKSQREIPGAAISSVIIGAVMSHLASCWTAFRKDKFVWQDRLWTVSLRKKTNFLGLMNKHWWNVRTSVEGCTEELSFTCPNVTLPIEELWRENFAGTKKICWIFVCLKVRS